MSLFPIVQSHPVAQADLPLYREVAWDYEHNRPLWRAGAPVVVTGMEEVKVWAYKALQVPRYQYEIYTANYGNEWQELIGVAYTGDLQRAEAIRYVKECLLINPYIVELRDMVVVLDGDRLRVDCKMVTVYGEVGLRV